MNYTPVELFAKTLIGSETVDGFKHGWEDHNSPL